MRLSTPPLILLALLGTAAILRPEVDEYLAEKDRRSIRIELAERGRIRAEDDIARGRLRWPAPCQSPVISAEWCRLYGIECVSPPEGTLLEVVYPGVEGRADTPSSEAHFYDFFMAAHICRLLGDDGLAHMRSLEQFLLTNPRVLSDESTPEQRSPEDDPFGIYRVGGLVLAPVELSRVSAAIPEQYRRARITQPLYIYEAVITSDGAVTRLRLLRGPTSKEPYVSFERAFREAFAQWRYRPATLHGRPVAVYLVPTATIEVR